MIIALEEAKRELVMLEETLTELGSALKIEYLREKVAELEKQTFVESFWADH